MNTPYIKYSFINTPYIKYSFINTPYIKQAVVKKIPTFLEDMLKKMYVEYTKCSKMMNPKSRDNIMLMRNSLVEMFKINPSITYTTVSSMLQQGYKQLTTKSFKFQ